MEPGAVRAADSSVIVKELHADGVFIHEGEAERWGLYTEYQYEPDSRLLPTWAQKALALQDHLGFPVVLLVIYLRKGERATFPERYHVSAGGLSNEFRFPVIRLWEHAGRIRSGELVELAPLLVLCEDRPAESVLEEERELLRAAELPHSVRSELMGLAYLLGMRYLAREILDAVFGEELPMLKDAGIISEWIEEGQARGLAEGVEQGLAQGRAEEARRFMLLFLSRRFGELPPHVIALVQAADPEWCEALLERAVRAETLEELGF